jgi:hypothetical protein
MKRTLTHLGVLGGTPPAGGGSNTGTVTVGGTVGPGHEGDPPASPPDDAAPETQTQQQGGGVAGAQAESKRASAKIKTGRNLRVDRKGRVRVRVVCEGDAGAVCKGTLRLARGNAVYGSKRYSIAAGKAKTVRLTLRSKARRVVKSGRSGATLSTGALRQAVRLK